MDGSLVSWMASKAESIVGNVAVRRPLLPGIFKEF
jgi:hypothetical protein